MIYQIRFADHAAKDLDRLDRDMRQRVAKRLEQLAKDPFDARLSSALTNKAGLRKSRIGGWRIIFTVDGGQLVVLVLMIGRRGQVYQRI